MFGREPEPSPPYSRDWGEVSSEETLIDGAARHMSRVGFAGAQPGDVLVFRIRTGAIAKHTAILSKPAFMIHAVEGCSVSEVPLGVWWQRRIAGVFVFPGA